MRHKIARKIKIAVLTLLPVIILLGVLASAEVYVRITKPQMSTLYFLTGADLQWKVKERFPGFNSLFDGDVVLGWKLKPNQKNTKWDYTFFSTNSRGMRYDKEVEDKSPSTFRIAAYGDSLSFGYRVPVIFPEENNISAARKAKEKTYWMWLQDKLSAQYKSKDIQVMSFGVPGYTTHQGLETMRRSIGWDKPDAVIIEFGWNDQERMFHDEDKNVFKNDFWSVLGKSILTSSQALMYLSGSIHNKYPTGNTDTIARVSKADYVANILAMCKLAKENGATPIVVLPIFRNPELPGSYGYDLKQYRDALREAIKGTDYLSVEIKELTGEGAPDNASLFQEVVHPNSDGYKLMAERISTLIESKKLIK